MFIGCPQITTVEQHALYIQFCPQEGFDCTTAKGFLRFYCCNINTVGLRAKVEFMKTIKSIFHGVPYEGNKEQIPIKLKARAF